METVVQDRLAAGGDDLARHGHRSDEAERKKPQPPPVAEATRSGRPHTRRITNDDPSLRRGTNRDKCAPTNQHPVLRLDEMPKPST
jgi:hypothetical protein